VCGLGEPFDRVESPVPTPGDLGHGAGDLIEAVGLHLVEHLSTLLGPADETDLLEHHEVLGDGLTGEGNTSRQ
jgi:hypothetical protein